MLSDFILNSVQKYSVDTLLTGAAEVSPGCPIQDLCHPSDSSPLPSAPNSSMTCGLLSGWGELGT